MVGVIGGAEMRGLQTVKRRGTRVKKEEIVHSGGEEDMPLLVQLLFTRISGAYVKPQPASHT